MLKSKATYKGYIMAVRRTGLTTLMKLAINMCTAVGKFTPLIQAYYPNSTALHAALASANAACAVLAAEAEAVLPVGD